MKIWVPLALTCAVAPGFLAWGMGRQLIRLREDPALPERLVGHRVRVGYAIGASLGLLLIVWPNYILWTIPLAVVATLVGGFPARKAVLEEQWGLAGYLAHVLRLWLAGLGFWILLAGAPAIVYTAGVARWPVIVLLGILLIAWNARYSVCYLWVVGASPIERPDLAPRFAAVLERARIVRPRLYRAGPSGGVFANALAFPSVASPVVLFGETLLVSLDPDELAAILAHEVAHLEHFDQPRLRRLALVVWLAITSGVLAVPLSLVWFPSYTATVGWVWPVLLVCLMLFVLGRQKAREAESDRRAVALCGDAEALVRGLEKIHAIPRLPRRWSLDMERSATHPSLAHRIQAIRAAARSASPRLAGPIAVATRAPGTFVVFEMDRVSWCQGVPPETPAQPSALREAAAAVQSVRYGELEELRVDASMAAPAMLVATARTGQTWSVELQPQDVAAAQSALDQVDVHLAPEVEASGHAGGAPRVARTSGAFCRDLGRNLCAGLRMAGMRRVPLAAFQVSPDHLVALVLLNLALLVAVQGVPGDMRAYWIFYWVSSLLPWVSLLLFAGFVMARLEGERVPALALPVVLLCIYPVFFGFSALWKLAEAVNLMKGRPEIRWGLWYGYYGGLALAAVLAIRTVVGRWSWRVPLYVVMLLALFYVPTWSLPTSTWWEKDADEERGEPQERRTSPAQEEILQLQPQLLQRELAAVRPQRSGVVDLYFVGFGGSANQDVFMKEVESVRGLFDERFDTKGRSLALINNRETMKRLPIATVSNLREALQRVRQLMHLEEDVLFLYLTSHGSESHRVSVSFWPLELRQIDPAGLRDLLDHAGIKWRVIAISACYSGGFIDPLKNDTTLILTAAAADKQSFGCGNEFEFTYFAKAYFDEALRQTHSFVAAFDQARAAIARREATEKKTPSNPQIFVGSAIRLKLEALQRRLAATPHS